HSTQNLSGVLLSHGHNDHCGGLKPLLRKTGPQKIYAHADIFKKRYWQGQHEQRDISLPYTREELECKGADFVFLDKLTEI
ncbi:MAG: MBL fold metallo-hydrolase, partial [Gammaproteobacteria bacterium]|nr:MBL fold metallo-hydrolase [Gammaproteobacteria bacterium]NIU11236.1 MBL fold metallo-hydrolase [Phycisphaerae bacterium]